MKKFWKNLCTYSLAVTCGVAVAGCGGNNDGNISRDLDGDGVISSWETVFTSEGASHRVIPTEEYVAINSVNDLLAINDNITFNSNKTYKLMRNIDCGGREISIDLFGAKFYGNNKIISNFKLGKVNFLTDPVEEGEREVISGVPETKALFYNGYAVYDLKVFMGNQKYVLEDSMSSSVYSPFVNIGEIDGVEVKGNIDITKNSKEDRGAHNELKASLLYSPVNLR